MKKIYLLILSILLAGAAVTAQNVTLTATGGVPVGVFTSLNAAFTAINSGTHTGSIMITIVLSTTESATASLNASGSGAASYTAILIKPATGTTPTIEGNLSAGPVINLNGASNVTIDGSNAIGGSTKDLIVSNTNTGTTASTLRFINGASDNMIKNSIFKSVTTGAINATIVFAGSTAVAGNNNNTVQNNDITKGVTSPTIAIYNSGSFGKLNTNNIVTGNRIFDFSTRGIVDLGYSDGFTISYNEIFLSTGSTSNVVVGIRVGNPGSNTIVSITINGNNIHDLSSTNATAVIYGMYIVAVNLSSSVTVTNNMISNLVNPVAGSGDVFGIFDRMETGSVAHIYYNSIFISGNSTGISQSACYAKDYQNLTHFKNNILVNNKTSTGSGIQCAYRFDGAAGGVINSDYNNIYNSGGSGNILAINNGTPYTGFAAWQAAVAPNDVNSINVQPNFIANNDLHLIPDTNCSLDDKGNNSGILLAADFDNDTRSTTSPFTTDIGADEFTALTTTLFTSTGTTLCDSRAMAPTGVYFKTNLCNPLARVVPSGGSPVTGNVNTCVYISALTNPTFNAEPYVQRHFDIEPATASSTATATVTLYFTDAEFVTFNANNAAFPNLPTVAGGGNADPNIANVRITQYHGTPTTTPSSPGNYSVAGGAGVRINPAGIVTNYNGNYWEITFPVTGFSGFYLHTNVNYALPITMNYFRGTRQGTNHLLNWKVTCNSTPRATLTLERSGSANGGFTAINTIDATAARCNQPFDYTDTRPLNGMNYYRVKMTDADGKVTYSSIVALLNATKGFEIVGIAPNPVVGGNFKLNVTSANDGRMGVVISDLQGRIVQRGNVTLSAGFSAIDMNVNNLASGTYNLAGITAEGKSKTIRFVKN